MIKNFVFYYELEEEELYCLLPFSNLYLIYKEFYNITYTNEQARFEVFHKNQIPIPPYSIFLLHHYLRRSRIQINLLFISTKIIHFYRQEISNLSINDTIIQKVQRFVKWISLQESQQIIEGIGHQSYNDISLIQQFILKQTYKQNNKYQKNIMNIIRKIDQFGQPYTQAVFDEGKCYKSTVGGLATLILYITSFIYFIYKIQLFSHNQILPSVSSAYVTNSLYNITLGERIVNLYFFIESIDPFDQKNLILIPQLYTIEDGKVINQTTLYAKKDIKNPNTKSSVLSLSNLNLIYSTEQNQTLEQSLRFKICEQQQNCANSSIINQFFQQRNLRLQIDTIIQSFDQSTQQMKNLQKETVLKIDLNTSLSVSFQFQACELHLDDDILFSTNKVSHFLSDFQHSVQQLTPQYFKRGQGESLSFELQLSINKIGSKLIVQYPKLGQVLADVGSIASTLLILGIIFQSLNKHFLQEDIIRRVIEIYYPDLKDMIMIKNKFGKLKRVISKGKEISAQEFQESYNILKSKTLHKLTLQNQIYEISKMQFLLYDIKRSLDKESLEKYGDNFKMATITCLDKVCPLDCDPPLETQQEQVDIFELFLSPYY
ncbi:hypothetical protein pb186bvf_013535 [Paramecium bursaria]